MRTNMLARDPLTPGTCEVCGKPCEMEDAACSTACEIVLLRREKEQGAKVLRLLKRWRKHRGRKGTPGAGALAEATALVDAFLKADREHRQAETIKRELRATENRG